MLCRLRDFGPSAAGLWLLAMSTAVAASLGAGKSVAFGARPLCFLQVTSDLHLFILRRSRGLDPSAAVLWLLAVSTAIAAALWAGSDFAFEAKLVRSTYDNEVHSNRQASGARPSPGPALENTGALHAGQRKPFAFSKHEVQSRPLALQGFYTSSHPPLNSSRSNSSWKKATAAEVSVSTFSCRDSPGRPLGWRCRLSQCRRRLALCASHPSC